MPQSLHVAQTPTLDDLSDGAPGIVTAVSLQFADFGQITHVRFMPTLAVGGTYTASVWEVLTNDDGSGGTGSLLERKVVSSAGITGGVWHNIELDDPVTIVPMTKLYRVGIHNSEGRYVATNSVFVSPLVNGDIIAENNGNDPVGLGSIGQGTFKIDADSTVYPQQVGTSADYFVDVVFVADDEIEPIPVEKSWVLEWNVLGPASRSYVLPWAVRAAATRSFVLPWAVRAAASRSYVLRWRVLADEVGGLPGLYPGLLAALKDALTGSRLRVESDPSATVGRRSVVVGPPAFIWSGGLCDPNDPDALTFEVYLIESLGERAIERLHAELPALIAALHGIEGCMITACVPGAFPSGTSDLPCYQITVSQDL